ncbi:hypothetical protein EPN90_01250 [Patescibacteria group bacterium]|nr:MAG: hypothetical protein EPN90_01250 [Patescibacteria group bacterium]
MENWKFVAGEASPLPVILSPEMITVPLGENRSVASSTKIFGRPPVLVKVTVVAVEVAVVPARVTVVSVMSQIALTVPGMRIRRSLAAVTSEGLTSVKVRALIAWVVPSVTACAVPVSVPVGAAALTGKTLKNIQNKPTIITPPNAAFSKIFVQL